MLKKINRGLRRRDFEEVREKGVLLQTPLFGVGIIKSENEELKVGWVISKKISKLAVERNRIKRYLAESVRKNLRVMKNKGYKLIFLVKKRILASKFEEIDEKTREIMEKIG